MKLKKIKLFLFIMIIHFSFSSNVFSQNLQFDDSGFSIGFILSPSFGILDLPNDFFNVYTAVNMNLGYTVALDIIGFSFLADVGYNYHVSVNTFGNSENSGTTKKSSHNIALGGLTKIHFGSFGLGFGVGVKMPLYSSESTVSILINTTSELDEEYQLTPYIKGIMEFAIPTSYRNAFILGMSLEYSFNADKSKPRLVDPQGIYIGFIIGGKYGPNI